MPKIEDSIRFKYLNSSPKRVATNIATEWLKFNKAAGVNKIRL